MADRFARAFWISLPLAALVALLSPFPASRWVGAAWLLLVGLANSFGNWAVLIHNLRGHSRSSFVPPIGVLLIPVAVLVAPPPTPRLVALLGLVLDPVPGLFSWHFVANGVRRRRPPNRNDTEPLE